MKVSLLYNVSAGEGLSAEKLCERLERCGHHVVHLVEKDAELERVLDEETDLVVAAGGDGTVWRAVSALAGSDIPLAIFPLGTANNIARSLGIEGSIGQLIEGWKTARRRPLDIGMASGGWGESRFVEGVGAGLVSSGISEMDGKSSDDKDLDADSRLARAVRRYRDVLSQLKPRPWKVTMDGHCFEGEFLLVEVLNIRSVGPNLVLAPEANPSDGLFDVVAAGEEHRDEIDDYLRQRIKGREGRLSLPTRRARHVEVEGWQELHVDDTVCAGQSIATVTIEAEPQAVRFLA